MVVAVVVKAEMVAVAKAEEAQGALRGLAGRMAGAGAVVTGAVVTAMVGIKEMVGD